MNDLAKMPDAKPVFRKPKPVPFAMLDNLTQAYDAGIAKKNLPACTA